MDKSHDGLDARAVPVRVHGVGGANAALSVSLPAVPGWVNVISGYDYTGTGATVGSVVTISAGIGGINRRMEVPANPLQVARDSWRPAYPLTSSAANSSLTVSVPALGAGNLGGELTVYGYRVRG